MKKRQIYFLLFDIITITIIFLFFIWIKPASLSTYLPEYYLPFLKFLGIWIISSLIFRKFDSSNRVNFTQHALPVFYSNVLALAILFGLMYFFGSFNYSRLIVFGTISVVTLFELSFAMVLNFVSKTKDELELKDLKPAFTEYESLDKILAGDSHKISGELKNVREKALTGQIGKNSYAFLAKYVDICDDRIHITNVDNSFAIFNIPFDKIYGLINIHRVNNFRFINKYFEAVNLKMAEGGIFIGTLESKDLRKERIYNEVLWGFRNIYYFFDFFINRVFPKFPVLKRFYFFLTKGQERVISRAECFGRLFSCGYKILGEYTDGGQLYFVAQKFREPYFDMNPTYGPFIKLRRVGKNGKIIKVYKFRTMHPYAEYLQEYIFDKHDLAEGGKIKDDFRVTTLGKLMRRTWLDELPMIYNFFKGDLKIVGVRPLSLHYYNLYSEELKAKRKLVKPGLVPPFYFDMPKSLEEIQESELKYINAYLKRPMWTDWRYFWKAFFNIVFKGARSN